MNFYHSVSANKAVNVQRFLDTYTGSVAAYSLRRLRTGYTGYAVEVRRASDNSTRQIGFDADGNFDVSELEQFCSGTDGYVKVWYDQTSNGYDLEQTDTAKQPKIHDSSTGVITATYGLNRPCIASVSRDSVMSNSSFSSELKDGYSYHVAGDLIAYNSPFFFIKNPSTTNGRVGFHSNGSNQATTYHQNVERPNVTSTGYANFSQRISGAYNFLQNVNYDGSTTSSVHIIRGDGYNVHGTADGVEQTAVPALSSTASGMNLSLFVQNPSDTYRGQGRIHEFIFWGEDKSSSQSLIESNLSDYYSAGRLNYDLPLDTYTNVVAAWSVRKVRSAYTGYCMEVYNGTTYADIGFNEFNELDVPAIAAHCGVNDGFVSKWYSQGTSTCTFVQTDSALMPQIYDGTSGTVFFSNGKPQVQGGSVAGGDGNTYMETSAADSINGHPNAHNFIVMARSDRGSSSDLNAVFSWGRYANQNECKYMTQGGNGGGAGVGTDLHIDGSPNQATKKNSFFAALGNNVPRIVSSIQNYNLAVYQSRTILGVTVGNIQHLQEILIFDDDMSDDREAIEQNQNSYFSVF